VPRILFLADTQIGVATVALDEQRDVLDRIVHTAWEHAVDVVVHGGDVFEGPIVTPEQMRMFLDAWEPLRGMAIPTVVLRGNGRHDAAVRPVHALDVLREIPGFIVADRPEAYEFDGFTLSALPWVHPAGLIARTNGSLAHDKVNSFMARALVDIARDLREPVIGPSVLVAHWAITGAKLPTGILADEMSEPVLPWAELDALGYDVIAGAHIHQPQRLDNPALDQTHGFVVGSPQQLNFGEHGEHGCWLVEVGGADELRFPPQFIPIPSRQFVTFDFDDPEGIALAYMDGLEIPEGAIVRMRSKMTAEQAQKLDQGKLRQALTQIGAASVRLDIDIEREVRRRAEITESLSAVEAMALYCDAVGIEDPLRAELLELIRDWAAK
jgi:DNA repair exonuclease SbcCD nuclease subunit